MSQAAVGKSSGTSLLRWTVSFSRAMIWTCIAAGPLLLFSLFHTGHVHNPELAGPTFHFYIVSLTSFIVLVLAVLMRVAAGHLGDPRALFLSLAFISIAGIFLVHALTTPAVFVPSFNPWVGFSARLSPFFGAVFLVAATVTWSPRARSTIVRYQREITGALVAVILAYGTLALVTSFQQSDLGGFATVLTGDSISYSLTGVTIAMLVMVIIRYVTIYRSSSTPLVIGILVSSVFLAQSKILMTFAPIWHASWWEYHVLMLAGFCVALGGLLWEYSNARSLRGTVGGLLLRDSLAQVQRGYTDVIVALIEAVEAKDPYTRGHTQQVSELSMLIAQQLGLRDEDQRALNQAAVLHDIGKIGIPDAVLNKPDKLTEHEFNLIKEHPVRGYRMIQHVRSLRRESEGVRYHHERLDGSGYPDGLIGDEIPLIARIIAVADVFDALTSARPYRDAFSCEEAVEIIKSERGTKLDPDCVDALLEALPIWLGRADKPQPRLRSGASNWFDREVAAAGAGATQTLPEDASKVH
jgi:hypothetical protein